jgi:hypothetical protein
MITQNFRLAQLLIPIVFLFTIAGCRNSGEKPATSEGDTLQPAPAKSANMPSQVDSTLAHTPPDTAAKPKSDLPPIAIPISPDRLAQFMPKMDGFAAGELQQETKIRKDNNSSKAARMFTEDGKKITIEINDFAYVPFLYGPFEQYRDAYLDDNNDERTETTTIGGYHAVQTWEKKSYAATIFVFPGKRFVVKLQADGIQNVGDARSILESMNLKGLEALQ